MAQTEAQQAARAADAAVTLSLASEDVLLHGLHYLLSPTVEPDTAFFCDFVDRLCGTPDAPAPGPRPVGAYETTLTESAFFEPGESRVSDTIYDRRNVDESTDYADLSYSLLNDVTYNRYVKPFRDVVRAFFGLSTLTVERAAEHPELAVKRPLFLNLYRQYLWEALGRDDRFDPAVYVPVADEHGAADVSSAAYDRFVIRAAVASLFRLYRRADDGRPVLAPESPAPEYGIVFERSPEALSPRKPLARVPNRSNLLWDGPGAPRTARYRKRYFLFTGKRIANVPKTEAFEGADYGRNVRYDIVFTEVRKNEPLESPSRRDPDRRRVTRLEVVVRFLRREREKPDEPKEVVMRFVEHRTPITARSETLGALVAARAIRGYYGLLHAPHFLGQALRRPDGPPLTVSPDIFPVMPPSFAPIYEYYCGPDEYHDDQGAVTHTARFVHLLMDPVPVQMRNHFRRELRPELAGSDAAAKARAARAVITGNVALLLVLHQMHTMLGMSHGDPHWRNVGLLPHTMDTPEGAVFAYRYLDGTDRVWRTLFAPAAKHLPCLIDFGRSRPAAPLELEDDYDLYWDSALADLAMLAGVYGLGYYDPTEDPNKTPERMQTTTGHSTPFRLYLDETKALFRRRDPRASELLTAIHQRQVDVPVARYRDDVAVYAEMWAAPLPYLDGITVDGFNAGDVLRRVLHHLVEFVVDRRAERPFATVSRRPSLALEALSHVVARVPVLHAWGFAVDRAPPPGAVVANAHAFFLGPSAPPERLPPSRSADPERPALEDVFLVYYHGVRPLFTRSFFDRIARESAGALALRRELREQTNKTAYVRDISQTGVVALEALLARLGLRAQLRSALELTTAEEKVAVRAQEQDTSPADELHYLAALAAALTARRGREAHYRTGRLDPALGVSLEEVEDRLQTFLLGRPGKRRDATGAEHYDIVSGRILPVDHVRSLAAAADHPIVPRRRVHTLSAPGVALLGYVVLEDLCYQDHVKHKKKSLALRPSFMTHIAGIGVAPTGQRHYLATNLLWVRTMVVLAAMLLFRKMPATEAEALTPEQHHQMLVRYTVVVPAPVLAEAYVFNAYEPALSQSKTTERVYHVQSHLRYLVEASGFERVGDYFVTNLYNLRRRVGEDAWMHALATGAPPPPAPEIAYDGLPLAWLRGAAGDYVRQGAAGELPVASPALGFRLAECIRLAGRVDIVPSLAVEVEYYRILQELQHRTFWRQQPELLETRRRVLAEPARGVLPTAEHVFWRLVQVYDPRLFVGILVRDPWWEMITDITGAVADSIERMRIYDVLLNDTTDARAHYFQLARDQRPRSYADLFRLLAPQAQQEQQAFLDLSDLLDDPSPGPGDHLLASADWMDADEIMQQLNPPVLADLAGTILDPQPQSPPPADGAVDLEAFLASLPDAQERRMVGLRAGVADQVTSVRPLELRAGDDPRLIETDSGDLFLHVSRHRGDEHRYRMAYFGLVSGTVARAARDHDHLVPHLALCVGTRFEAPDTVAVLTEHVPGVPLRRLRTLSDGRAAVFSVCFQVLATLNAVAHLTRLQGFTFPADAITLTARDRDVRTSYRLHFDADDVLAPVDLGRVHATAHVIFPAEGTLMQSYLGALRAVLYTVGDDALREEIESAVRDLTHPLDLMAHLAAELETNDYDTSHVRGPPPGPVRAAYALNTGPGLPPSTIARLPDYARMVHLAAQNARLDFWSVASEGRRIPLPPIAGSEWLPAHSRALLATLSDRTDPWRVALLRNREWGVHVALVIGIGNHIVDFEAVLPYSPLAWNLFLLVIFVLRLDPSHKELVLSDRVFTQLPHLLHPIPRLVPKMFESLPTHFTRTAGSAISQTNHTIPRSKFQALLRHWLDVLFQYS